MKILSWGRVFKAKYYRHSDFFGSSLGTCGSYVWKSLWGTKFLVKEWILWRVGKGTEIKVWEEPWVINGDSCFITSTRVERIEHVCDLIQFDSMEWDANRILSSFDDQNVRAILAIPLSERLPEDTITWAYSDNGMYTVKTTNMMGKSGNLDQFCKAWVCILGLDVSSKIRQFLWRPCSSFLLTRAMLKQRHIIDDDSCPLCHAVP